MPLHEPCGCSAWAAGRLGVSRAWAAVEPPVPTPGSLGPGGWPRSPPLLRGGADSSSDSHPCLGGVGDGTRDGPGEAPAPCSLSWCPWPLPTTLTGPYVPAAVLCQLRPGGHERVHRLPQGQLLLHLLPAQGTVPPRPAPRPRPPLHCWPCHAQRLPRPAPSTQVAKAEGQLCPAHRPLPPQGLGGRVTQPPRVRRVQDGRAGVPVPTGTSPLR